MSIITEGAKIGRASAGTLVEENAFNERLALRVQQHKMPTGRLSTLLAGTLWGSNSKMKTETSGKRNRKPKKVMLRISFMRTPSLNTCGSQTASPPREENMLIWAFLGLAENERDGVFQ